MSNVVAEVDKYPEDSIPESLEEKPVADGLADLIELVLLTLVKMVVKIGFHGLAKLVGVKALGKGLEVIKLGGARLLELEGVLLDFVGEGLVFREVFVLTAVACA